METGTVTPNPFLLRFCHLFDMFQEFVKIRGKHMTNYIITLLRNYLKPVYLIEMVELNIALIIQTLYVLNEGKCWLDALEVAQNQGYSIQKDNKGMYVYRSV